MITPKSRQKWLFELLKKEPACTYLNAFHQYKQRYDFSETTFVSDWKKANKELETWQNKVSSEVQKQEIQIEVEARKGNILTKIEALAVLSQIARGEPLEKDNKKYYPSFRDQINAVTQLAKIEGWEAKETQTGNIEIASWVKTTPLTIEVIDSRDKVINE